MIPTRLRRAAGTVALPRALPRARSGILLGVLPVALVAVLAAPAHAQGTAPNRAPAAAPGATPSAAPPAASSPSSAPAQPQFTQSHLALAREVMLTSGIARSFDSILPAFGDQIRQAAGSRPELSKDLNEVLAGIQPELELQKQEMINVASRIYASRLSEAELRDVAAFFRSPPGRRYVETQPQVLDDMVQAMQGWTQNVSEYVMVRVRAEMGKRGHQLQ